MAASRTVAVACSGGRDSTALLHATLKAVRGSDIAVWALHVHHDLQPAADRWERQVRERCARWAARGDPLRLAVTRLASRPGPGDSIEAWARRERYAALAVMARAAGCELVLLAHHRRDQAETLLLQALRGAGAAGLAAMPARIVRDGIVWARPWLDQPRTSIESYVRRHRLVVVEDPSNADTRFDRSRLRTCVWPVLLEAFPQAESALTASARRLATERQAIEQWVEQDLQTLTAGSDDVLSLAAWQALSPSRRELTLRAWLLRRQGRGASEPLVVRLMHELLQARTPARWPADVGELCRYRGRLSWVAGERDDAATVKPGEFRLNIAGPGLYPVPGWGALEVQAATDGGVSWELLHDLRLTLREAGARFQFEPASLPRSLKKQYQARGVPPWHRDGPLVHAGDKLVFVPGLGIDARVAAPSGTAQALLHWHPAPAKAGL